MTHNNQMAGISLPLNSKTLVLIGTCLVTTGLTVYYWTRKRLVWIENAARVKSLIIYPIKSVPGFNVDEVQVEKTHISYGKIKDRNMVLLSKDRRIVTLRQAPQLGYIRVEPNAEKNAFTLTAPGMDKPLTIRPKEKRDPKEEVISFKILFYPTQGVPVSQEASEWFSKYLGQEVVLVEHFPDLIHRPTYFETKNGIYKDLKVPVTYNDAAPVYLCCQESIDKLNLLVPDGKPLFDNRSMRGVVLTEGSASQDEEDWSHLRINGIVFKNVYLNDKCVVPTVDPDKCEKMDWKMDVMTKFRVAKNDFERKNYENKPLFGINLVNDRTGVLRVGMQIDVSKKTA